jgi:dTDP-4-dehydrorhamnose 3,5-epimerase
MQSAIIDFTSLRSVAIALSWCWGNLVKISSFDISGPILFSPPKFGDVRGFFSETYNQHTFSAVIGDVRFVQDNHSFSLEAGTLRGLHFQVGQKAQGKLIRAVRGSIFDVAVDIRRQSPTFGLHISAMLSAENWSQLWVPAGFAHGFCTLEPNTEVIYKVTQFYSPADERGIAWNDPALGIQWPHVARNPILAEKDMRYPALADIQDHFEFSAAPGD